MNILKMPRNAYGFVDITDSKRAIFIILKFDMTMIWPFIRCDLCIISPPILILSYRCKKPYISTKEVMFWSFCLVCTSVSRIGDKVMNEFACMKLLSGVYLGPRNNLIHFEDDLDYDPDCDPYYTAEVCNL